MRALALVVLLALLPWRSAPADEGEPSHAPRRDTVEAALREGDERSAAWAAWEAGRRQWGEAVPFLERRLWTQSRLRPGQRTWELNQVLLDALVRLQARVSDPYLLRHRDAHRDVVALLLARSGDAEAQLTFLEDSERLYAADPAALVVGNALANQASPGVAAHLLSALRFERTVHVFTPLPPGGRRPGDDTISGSLRTPPEAAQEALPDYPPIGIWRLALHSGPDAERVGSGPIPVWVRRESWTTRYRVVGGGEGQWQPWATSHRTWLAHLADLPASDLALPATARIDHDDHGPPSFRARLRREHEALVQRYWEIVDRLVDRDVLTPEEARQVDPRIEWTVIDRRHSKRVPLPPVPAMESGNPYREAAAARRRDPRAL